MSLIREISFILYLSEIYINTLRYLRSQSAEFFLQSSRVFYFIIRNSFGIFLHDLQKETVDVLEKKSTISN